MQPQYQQENPLCTFFLFVNSGSGGGLGVQIVSQEIEKIQFDIPIKNEKDIHRVDVYFFNMRKKREQGFRKLKELNDKKQKTIAIVCGGDGTVMWVVGEFIKYKIDPMKTPIAIIPLGTGNDFSRALGWGPQKTMLLEKNYKSLKKLIRKWLNATQHNFDLWDVTAEIFPNGKFEKVQNSENKLVEGDKITKTFCNYFSFGIDGKIGYSFDMHRTQSRIGNLAVYGGMGFLKSMTKTKTIDELVENMEENHEQVEETGNSRMVKSEGPSIFKSQKRMTGSQKVLKEENETFIKDGYQNILALNIDSFTGGVSGIWDSAKDMFTGKKTNSTNPSFSDKKLQIVSFGSGISMALQRTFSGNAKKIVQGGGPYTFNFKKYENDPKHRTYLQIDGQFIRFTQPKLISLKHSNIVPNGQIRVLRNDPTFEPYMPKQ